MKNQAIIQGNPNNDNKAVTLWEKEVLNPDTNEMEDQTFGKVRVDEVTIVMKNGFASPRRRSAFITLTEAALDHYDGLLEVGMPYPEAGKIVVTETASPQYDGHKPKREGSAADAKIVLSGGKPVYRSTEFVYDLEATDTLLPTDKVEAGVPATAAKNEAAE